MKNKLLLFFISIALVGTMTGCNNARGSNNNIGNVKLTSIEATHITDRQEKKQRANEDNSTSYTSSEDTSLNYQYIVLNENEKDFNVTINLYNPSDYHILDFNLTCDDKDLKVYVDNTYTELSTLNSLNWLGTTNTSYTLKFESDSDEFLSTLKINKLLYVNRNNTSVKYNGDVSTNNEVDIYRINDIKANDIKLNKDGLSYILTSEDTHLSNIKVNGEETQLNEPIYYNGKLEKASDLNLSVEYDITINDKVIHNTSLLDIKFTDYAYYRCMEGGIDINGNYFVDNINLKLRGVNEAKIVAYDYYHKVVENISLKCDYENIEGDNTKWYNMNISTNDSITYITVEIDNIIYTMSFSENNITITK